MKQQITAAIVAHDIAHAPIAGRWPYDQAYALGNQIGDWPVDQRRRVHESGCGEPTPRTQTPPPPNQVLIVGGGLGGVGAGWR
jgi:hypothetical protein